MEEDNDDKKGGPQRALEDGSRDAKKQRRQQGKYVSVQAILSYHDSSSDLILK